MSGIVVASLLALVLCAIINVWWKISSHMVSIGGAAGALLCFGELFAFNPIWWFCLTLILAGILGTSRITLRIHTLSQVLGGFALGLICAFVGILYFTI
jgi:membrane-associated phospholipid phosphatase